MPVPHTEWTAEEAIALPWDGRRYEVLDGDLVVTPSPSWRHQTAVEHLHLALAPWVAAHAIGWVKLSPADLVLSPRRLVQPDLFVVPRGEGTEPRAWSEVRALLLVVEVLSPSTAHVDRMRKRRLYQDEGVPEYWIIDPDARLVERWRPGDERPEVLHGALEWRPGTGQPAFTLDLVTFFDAVCGPAHAPPGSRDRSG